MKAGAKHNLTWFYCGAVLFSASFLLLFLARKIKGMAQWYAAHIYPVIVGCVGRISGIFPVSAAEILLYVVILVAAALAVRLLIRLIIPCRTKPAGPEGMHYGILWSIPCRTKSAGSAGTPAAGHPEGMGKRGKLTAHYFSGIWLTASVLFLLYTLNCGINYQRRPFSECEGIKREAYSVEELQRVCESLTQDVNTYAGQAERDAGGLMVLDGSERELAVQAMHRLGEHYQSMEGYYPKPKALAGSWLLSVQNLTGIYAPFTVEANYNNDMPDYNIPFTACHELSHLRGFMQEEEANFIAYLACMESGSAEFRYSGSLLGWIHCMNALRGADAEAWREVREQLSEEVELDLEANHEFWAAYDGKVAEVSEKVNDNYLKANGQDDGIRSYGRMVDLLVAYFQETRT